jgi:hypothetical protein
MQNSEQTIGTKNIIFGGKNGCYKLVSGTYDKGFKANGKGIEKC